ncbi:MAG: hypothetical protein HY033_08455 [Ignavibacteriae bacterium]|nr:hypothetical protein [Ignavibacteriota bacterium]
MIEVFKGFRCRAVGQSVLSRTNDAKRGFPIVLLAPYLERYIQSIDPKQSCTITMTIHDKTSDHSVRSSNDSGRMRTPQHRRESSQTALENVVRDFLSKMLHRPIHNDAFLIEHDVNGKPIVRLTDEHSIVLPTLSAAHTDQMTLATASDDVCVCDVEKVLDRPNQIWHDLLGNEGIALGTAVAAEAKEDTVTAYTRVWTVIECLKKSAVSVSPLPVLRSTREDSWVTFSLSHHSLDIHTLSFLDGRRATATVVALLLRRSGDARAVSKKTAVERERHARL